MIWSAVWSGLILQKREPGIWSENWKEGPVEPYKPDDGTIQDR
jgi:hypothetical protein